jgi:ribonuclease J
MKKNKTPNKPLIKNFDPEKLYFVPLGGAEQFGVNFNLYTIGGRWIAVDLGMGFADEKFPGIDIMLPDPAFLEERLENLEALIITHAHEDHIGAVPRLWPRLKCPIYCGAFTAAILRQKFQEFPECKKAKINIVGFNETIELGPFSVKFLPVTHSIPEASSLLIGTSLGKILHSGDWNLDPAPVLGNPVDIDLFKSIGDEGVLAYIGDSTNAPSPGRSASEGEVAEGLEAVFRECTGRIAVTIFASNVGRVRTIVKAAKACNRKVAIVGRSLHNMTNAARTCGYMKDIHEFLTEDDVESMPDKSIVMIVTGSQGEARAALARMARGEHQNISLKRGDTVIFSARAIPGNEKEIDIVKNNLSAAGVKIIGESDTPHLIHASGHPRSDEIRDMLSWVRPQIVVPVHGERLQLEAHAQLARDMGVKETIVPVNGAVICLAPGPARIEDHVPTGLLAVETNRIIKADHEAISARRKLQFSGTVHVSLVMDDRGELLADPKISTIGLIDPSNENEKKIETELVQEVEDILADMSNDDILNDHMVHEEIRIGVRRFVQHVLAMKPNTTVHVVRLEE